MNSRRRNGRPVISAKYSTGITLIEVLISLLILSIGILGLATLQTASINFNASASQRSQATILAYDMADRMRANRQAALADAYTVAFQNPVPACAAPNLAGTVAQQDLAVWRSAISCRLPVSTGSIVRNGTEFTLSVRWDDIHGAETALFQFTTAL